MNNGYVHSIDFYTGTFINLVYYSELLSCPGGTFSMKLHAL